MAGDVALAAAQTVGGLPQAKCTAAISSKKAVLDLLCWRLNNCMLMVVGHRNSRVPDRYIER